MKNESPHEGVVVKERSVPREGQYSNCPLALRHAADWLNLEQNTIDTGGHSQHCGRRCPRQEAAATSRIDILLAKRGRRRLFGVIACTCTSGHCGLQS